MCGLGGSSYTPSPTPSIVPVTTYVSSGTPSDSETVQAKLLEKMRKRQGFASTIRNEGGAQGLDNNSGGKTYLGQ